MAEKNKNEIKNTTEKKSLKATNEKKKLEERKKALKSSDDIAKNINKRKKKRTTRKKKKQKKKEKIVFSIIAIFVVVTVAIMAFNFTYVYNGRIARNIYIEGMSVSGMKPDDVKEELNKKYKVDNIKFEYNDKEYVIKPETVGLKYNIDQIVDEAYGYTRDGSYYKDLYNYFSLKNKSLKKNIEVVYDSDKMKKEIEKIAKTLDKDPKDATIKIDGSIKTTKSSDGVKLNISKTLSNLTSSIDNKKKETIPLVMEKKEAKIKTKDVETKSSDGVKLNISKTLSNLTSSIDNKKKETIPLVMEKKEAKIKTKDVESVNTKLADYTTSFEKSDSQRSHNVEKSAKITSDILLMPGEVFSYNAHTGKTNSKNGYQEAPIIINGKSHNVEKSAKITSDILLMPGEVFSYNAHTGKTNSKNGYQEAPIIINGKLEKSAGGGVCQTSSTIFNTALLSGMDIVSVTNHSASLTYVPLGRDATVNDSGLDFKFKNTFDHPVYIKNTVNNKRLTCTIYGNSIAYLCSFRKRCNCKR